MLVEDMFKTFTSTVLRETKNKLDYDTCIDVYAKTQLLDISGIFNNPEFNVDFGGGSADITYENHKVTAITKWNNLEVVLPFESCFIKLYDNNTIGYDSASYLFIREFAPMVHTGVLIIELTKAISYRVTFNIQTNFFTVEKTITAMFKDITNSDDDINKLVKFTLSRLRYSLNVLEKLNGKNQNIYKVKPNKPEYLRKKDKTTVKVSRPIYIYLNKSDEITVFKDYAKRNVERLTSWLVRGHWRRLDDPKKRGKNANGEYVVEGYTWVVPHVCGNQDMPVQSRTYIAINN